MVQKADLGAAIKWKIAFLYQDRTAPSVLPIFSADHLVAWLETRSRRNVAALHAAAMAKRGDADVFSFGAQIWEKAAARLAAMTLNPDDALAFFQENPERFQPIKEPTKYIAGFTTTEGRSLALARDAKGVKLWLEPGAWLDTVKGQLKDIEEYPAERSRNSNLGANAPQLAQGNPAIYLAVPTRAALLALCNAYDNSDLEDNDTMPPDFSNLTPAKVPLNQILYGPPGTGKTYATITETLSILDPELLQEKPDDRAAHKLRFDALARSGQIRFVTFHQSFSYEDFVEGLRSDTGDNGTLRYDVVDGVFKSLCESASAKVERQIEVPIDLAGRRIWKMSLGNSKGWDSYIYDECIENGFALLGWGGEINFQGCQNRSEIYQRFIDAGENVDSADYAVSAVATFLLKVKKGDLIVVTDGLYKFRAVGEVTGNYRVQNRAEQDDGYGQCRDVRWLRVYNPSLPFEQLMNNQFSQMTLYELKAGSIDKEKLAALLSLAREGVNNILSLNQDGQAVGGDRAMVRQPPESAGIYQSAHNGWVLIIDEINRGNISRIFGELITLIEPSKRAGADEALSVTLPYSKKPFSVPSNVYLIGTMNTADRSLAGLDIALRRRFTFKEMPPQPALLDAVTIEGVNIGQLLRKMNERIEVLLDRDHCLGHAYFMPLKEQEKPTLAELGDIFRQQILPLLQEYFFEDWERIAWVLNNRGKHPAPAFVEKASTNLASLFGAAVAETLENADRRWRINGAAFDDIESYRRILGEAA
ncbi:AAA family ATPase [Janthinobacterium sp. 17J80-10]|uniref:AAA family ATPase n=1 Tax=Janthinobacterium sp. 17J80-10 TaxID=2497863 RepID=UPI001F50CC8A|nr:AAA family ATPase [Janthinobacterium sp. 17J80-10]